MISFIDYSYYRDVYCGRLVSEEDFGLYSKAASYKVNGFCFGRAEEIVREEQEFFADILDATCGVMDEMYNHDQQGTKTAERVGEVSVSYAVGTVGKSEDLYYNAARLYLEHTGLLNRGVYP